MEDQSVSLTRGRACDVVALRDGRPHITRSFLMPIFKRLLFILGLIGSSVVAFSAEESAP